MAKGNRPSILDLFRDKLMPQRTITPAGQQLVKYLDEQGGWRQFLSRLGPETFTQPFAEFHEEFWDWYWEVTLRRVNNQSLRKNTLSFLAGWPRGGGKSSNVEWACVTEGTMGLDGYVLYVSLAQDSANSHVSDVRRRLESETIERYFPDLASPKIGRHGNQYGWRQVFLITQGGWAIRPLGLDVAVRGIKEGELRPSIIVFDDIDDFKLTLAAVKQNLSTISRSILPAGTVNTVHLIAQNLIAEHCAVNQIYTGKTDVLKDHIASVHQAFSELEIETRIDDKTGKTSYHIMKGVPNWAGMDMEAATVFLNKVGLEAFHAEYQHDFSLDQTERVIPEFDSERLPSCHVITWSQFEELFGTRYRVPKHWQIGVGLDIGYTTEHLSAWSWIAVSAEDSVLPNAHFLFRGLTFQNVSINDQAEQVLETIQYATDEETLYDERQQYVVMRMSHEKKGERMVLNRQYELNFAIAQFGKEDGLPQWRTLLRPDMHRPHPFHPDEKKANGRHEYGRPNFFFVVEDDQLGVPRNDAGLAVHRSQIATWKRRKVKITETGAQQDIPMKVDDDAMDATRMILAESHLAAEPLTDAQALHKRMRERLGTEDLEIPNTSDYHGHLMKRRMILRELQLKQEREEATDAGLQAALIQPPRRF